MVECVVLNALAKTAAAAPDIRAFGDSFFHRLGDKPIHP
jgi:hypothetical protein